MRPASPRRERTNLSFLDELPGLAWSTRILFPLPVGALLPSRLTDNSDFQKPGPKLELLPTITHPLPARNVL